MLFAGSTTAALQDLFYRCRFSQLLAELSAYEDAVGAADAERTLLRANALFELHRVNEAKAVLKSLSQTADSFDAGYLYALARLSYFDDDLVAARGLFQTVHEQSPHYGFKSLLGVANTHYTAGDFTALPPLIAKLHAYEPLPKDDERISLLIFIANYHLATASGPTAASSQALARDYYRKALAHAAANTWTYFITRSLYGMASLCERAGQTSELMWTLDLLQSFVDQSEQRYFSYVVNGRFKNYVSINTPMEFDTANKRILINNTWLPCHDKPLLFHFLLLLHDRGEFVDKHEIAQKLWPRESYKPRLHDPRIFDIAKRARGLIEAYEHQPVVLLSGRLGYKLAST